MSTESRVLQEVRRWRREAYEKDRTLSADQHKARLAELAARFGLRIRRHHERGGNNTDR